MNSSSQKLPIEWVLLIQATPAGAETDMFMIEFLHALIISCIGLGIDTIRILGKRKLITHDN